MLLEVVKWFVTFKALTEVTGFHRTVNIHTNVPVTKEDSYHLSEIFAFSVFTAEKSCRAIWRTY